MPPEKTPTDTAIKPWDQVASEARIDALAPEERIGVFKKWKDDTQSRLLQSGAFDTPGAYDKFTRNALGVAAEISDPYMLSPDERDVENRFSQWKGMVYGQPEETDEDRAAMESVRSGKVRAARVGNRIVVDPTLIRKPEEYRKAIMEADAPFDLKAIAASQRADREQEHALTRRGEMTGIIQPLAPKIMDDLQRSQEVFGVDVRDVSPDMKLQKNEDGEWTIPDADYVADPDEFIGVDSIRNFLPFGKPGRRPMENLKAYQEKWNLTDDEVQQDYLESIKATAPTVVERSGIPDKTDLETIDSRLAGGARVINADIGKPDIVIADRNLYFKPEEFNKAVDSTDAPPALKEATKAKREALATFFAPGLFNKLQNNRDDFAKDYAPIANDSGISGKDAPAKMAEAVTKYYTDKEDQSFLSDIGEFGGQLGTAGQGGVMRGVNMFYSLGGMMGNTEMADTAAAMEKGLQDQTQADALVAANIGMPGTTEFFRDLAGIAPDIVAQVSLGSLTGGGFNAAAAARLAAQSGIKKEAAQQAIGIAARSGSVAATEAAMVKAGLSRSLAKPAFEQAQWLANKNLVKGAAGNQMAIQAGYAGLTQASQTFADLYGTLVEQGMSKEDAIKTARTAAAAAGGITSTITGIFSARGMGGVEKPLDPGKYTLRDLMRNGVVKALATPETRAMVVKASKAILKDAKDEGIEEGLDQFMQGIAAYMTNPTEEAANKTLDQLFAESIHAARLGSGAGGLASAARNLQRTTNLDADQIQQKEEIKTILREAAAKPATPKQAAAIPVEQSIEDIARSMEEAEDETETVKTEAVQVAEAIAPVAPATAAALAEIAGETLPDKPAPLPPEEDAAPAPVPALEEPPVEGTTDLAGVPQEQAASEQLVDDASSTPAPISPEAETPPEVAQGLPPEVTTDAEGDPFQQPQTDEQGPPTLQQEAGAAPEPAEVEADSGPDVQESRELPLVPGEQDAQGSEEGGVVRDATKPELATVDELKKDGFTQRSPEDVRVFKSAKITQDSLTQHLEKNGFKPGDVITTPNGEAEIYISKTGFAYSWRPKKGNGRDGRITDPKKGVRLLPTKWRDPQVPAIEREAGTNAPEGYVKQGDLYIFQPTQQAREKIKDESKQTQRLEKGQQETATAPEAATDQAPGPRAVKKSAKKKSPATTEETTEGATADQAAAPSQTSDAPAEPVLSSPVGLEEVAPAAKEVKPEKKAEPERGSEVVWTMDEETDEEIRESKVERQSVVTPEQDAEYMAAVESGDMETAQRMVDAAAEAVGAIGPVWRSDEGGMSYMDRDAVFFAYGNNAERMAAYYDRLHTRKFFVLPKLLVDARGKISEYLRSLGASEMDYDDKAGRRLIVMAEEVEEGSMNPWDPFNSDTWKMAAPSGSAVLFDGDWPGQESQETGETIVINFPEPSQIKSADPVTRDESGNVIPLSKRFDQSSDDIRFSRKGTAKGMSPGLVSNRLKTRWGTGKIVTVVNQPDADWDGRSIFRDGELVRIELNAAHLPDNDAVDRVIFHELAEAANKDGALDELTAALSPEQQQYIRKTVERLGYDKAVRNREEAARSVEALAKAFSTRAWWQRMVAAVLKWAKDKLGIPMTRLAAERIAASQVAAVHERVKAAFNPEPAEGEMRESKTSPAKSLSHPAFTQPLNSYEYQPAKLTGRAADAFDASRRQFKGPARPVQAPQDLYVAIQGFERATGLSVITFRGEEDVGNIGFLNPGFPQYVFVNAASPVAASSVLAHEWAHAAEKDSKAKSAVSVARKDILALVNPETSGEYIQWLQSNYPETWEDEFFSNTISDALSEKPEWDSDEYFNDWSAVTEIADRLFQDINPLAPSALGDLSEEDDTRYSKARSDAMGVKNFGKEYEVEARKNIEKAVRENIFDGEKKDTLSEDDYHEAHMLARTLTAGSVEDLRKLRKDIEGHEAVADMTTLHGFSAALFGELSKFAGRMIVEGGADKSASYSLFRTLLDGYGNLLRPALQEFAISDDATEAKTVVARMLASLQSVSGPMKEYFQHIQNMKEVAYDAMSEAGFSPDEIEAIRQRATRITNSKSDQEEVTAAVNAIEQQVAPVNKVLQREVEKADSRSGGPLSESELALLPKDIQEAYRGVQQGRRMGVLKERELASVESTLYDARAMMEEAGIEGLARSFFVGENEKKDKTMLGEKTDIVNSEMRALIKETLDALGIKPEQAAKDPDATFRKLAVALGADELRLKKVPLIEEKIQQRITEVFEASSFEEAMQNEKAQDLWDQWLTVSSALNASTKASGSVLTAAIRQVSKDLKIKNKDLENSPDNREKVVDGVMQQLRDFTKLAPSNIQEGMWPEIRKEVESMVNTLVARGIASRAARKKPADVTKKRVEKFVDNSLEAKARRILSRHATLDSWGDTRKKEKGELEKLALEHVKTALPDFREKAEALGLDADTAAALDAAISSTRSTRDQITKYRKENPTDKAKDKAIERLLTTLGPRTKKPVTVKAIVEALAEFPDLINSPEDMREVVREWLTERGIDTKRIKPEQLQTIVSTVFTDAQTRILKKYLGRPGVKKPQPSELESIFRAIKVGKITGMGTDWEAAFTKRFNMRGFTPEEVQEFMQNHRIISSDDPLYNYHDKVVARAKIDKIFLRATGNPAPLELLGASFTQSALTGLSTQTLQFTSSLVAFANRIIEEAMTGALTGKGTGYVMDSIKAGVDSWWRAFAAAYSNDNYREQQFEEISKLTALRVAFEDARKAVFSKGRLKAAKEQMDKALAEAKADPNASEAYKKAADMLHEQGVSMAELEDNYEKFKNAGIIEKGKLLVKLAVGAQDFFRKLMSSADDAAVTGIKSFIRTAEYHKVLRNAGLTPEEIRKLFDAAQMQYIARLAEEGTESSRRPDYSPTNYRAWAMDEKTNALLHGSTDKAGNEVSQGIVRALAERYALQKIGDGKGLTEEDKKKLTGEALEEAQKEILSEIENYAQSEAEIDVGVGLARDEGNWWDFAQKIGEGFVSALEPFLKYSPRRKNQKGANTAGKYLAARMLLGFIRTPFNFYSRSIYRGPLGLYRLALSGARPGKYSEKAAKKYQRTMGTARQQQKRWQEALIGTAAWAALIGMVQALKGDDDEEDGIIVNGGGPADPQAREAWKSQGHQPHSIELNMGGAKVTIPFGRAGLEAFKPALMLLGAYNDMMMNDKTGREQAGVFRYAWNYGKQTFETANLFGLRNVMALKDAMGDEQSLAKRAAYTFSPFIPFAGFQKSIGQVVNPGRADDKTLAGAIALTTPVWWIGEKAYNMYGQPVYGVPNSTMGKISRTLMYAVGLPFSVDTQGDPDAIRAMEYTLQTGDAPSFPSRNQVDARIRRGDRNHVALSDEQWVKYLKASGAVRLEGMKSFAKRADKMSEDAQTRQINAISERAYREGIRAAGR